MATHKVPQDVEADDKLVGFLSLKQFIFVLLGIGFGYLTFVFFTKVHPITSIIWLPPMVVFLVLGLYQRKDQPVEVFLASALQFYLKPHGRHWNQEGYEERVIITAPPKLEKHYSKDLTQEQVSSHLGNISRLMDSRGWASKLVTDWQNPQLAMSAASDRLMQPGDMTIASATPDQPVVYQPVDVMDDSSSRVAQNFESGIQQSGTATHQQALRTIQQARTSAAADDGTSVPPEDVRFQKYPSMRQKVVQPTTSSDQPAQPEEVTQQLAQLSKNDAVDVQTLATAAHHITESTDEVEVKLH